MKKQKGFTLIELLAVIVILAIIALIVVPVILNMIKTSRKKASVSAAYGYIDAINYNNELASMGEDYTDIGYEATTTGENINVTTINSTIKMKGKKPESGTVTINLKGKVTSANDLCFEGYPVDYDGKTARIDTEASCSSSSNNNSNTNNNSGSGSGSGSGSSTYTAYTVGQSINFNPVTNQKCTNPTSTTGTKTGCMKWYVIKASGTSDSTVDVILDHNTTATVAWVTKADYNDNTKWNNYNRNDKGPITANEQLATDTTGWASGLSPRLITANEIAAITGNTTFDGSNSKWFYFGSNDSTYYSLQTDVEQAKQESLAWLFDYTKNCTTYGCNTADSSNSGYWTSSPPSDDSSTVWLVNLQGMLGVFDVYVDNIYGIRPVITISKSSLQ